LLNLLLAVASSAMVAIVMRLSSHRVKGGISMLSANYLVCTVLGTGYALAESAPLFSSHFPALAGLALINGILLLAGFLLMQHHTRKDGVVLSSVFMKLGLLIPFLVSILFFREMPTLLQSIGFCLAICAILLINLKPGQRLRNPSWGLLLLLLAGGGSDAMAKVFRFCCPAQPEGWFLALSFAVAFFLCSAIALGKKHLPGKEELFFGALIGIPNFFSSKFLLGALTHIPAVVVYPTFSVTTMFVVTLAGVLVFRETLTRRQWLALGIIMTALILLNI
jgi:drug/metabolite transporter (DMT)-like permease